MTTDFLKELGVQIPKPSIIPFDPGYDPITFKGHIAQSHTIINSFKISMATWIVVANDAINAKIQCLKDHEIPIIVGGTLFEIAFYKNKLVEYLELCSQMGFDIIEAGQGFTKTSPNPKSVIDLALKYNLEVQYEIGEKFTGAFTEETLRGQVEVAKQWIDNGARYIVIEAKEDAVDVGLFDESGNLQRKLADSLVHQFGSNINLLQFEAPTKKSQFQLIDHFGSEIKVSNVRLEEIARVQIYRLGLHPKAFQS
jgi:phosphosulfolactate synthase